MMLKKETSSIPGESAAVRHIQMDLLGLGDKPKLDDNDPAVEKTVENLSDARSDALAVVQKKDTRSTGGISSR